MSQTGRWKPPNLWRWSSNHSNMFQYLITMHESLTLQTKSDKFNLNYRNRFLSEIIAFHLQLLVLLQSTVKEDYNVNLSGLKCTRQKLYEFKTTIELSTAGPICVDESNLNDYAFVVVVVIRHMESLDENLPE